MASFPICPLIDSRSFVGISEDIEPNCMIASLGKKIIIRFRLHDQKQLSSWATKDKLTTPVYYDPGREEYFGVFNGELISQWPRDKNKITCVGKYKLPWLVHSVHILKGIRPVLLSASGKLAFLGVEKKKSIHLIKENVLPKGEILETKAFSICDHNYLCFLVKIGNDTLLKFVVISESDDNSFDIKLSRDSSSSSLTCFTIIEDKAQLVTLWSDGCLFSFDIDISCQNHYDFPGKSITTFSSINCLTPCVMLALDNNHIAVYGADSNGEGATVIWLEANYGVIRNTLHLKLYCNPPKMWKIGNSYLITPVGLNLCVIPYQLKKTPTLDSVLAAQVPTESTTTNIEWEISKYRPINNLENVLIDQNDGLPEYIISQRLTSSLLEKNKVKETIDKLNQLSDIPDKCIIDTIVCTLNSNIKNKNELIKKSLKFSVINDNKTLGYLREKMSFSFITELFDILSELLENEPENDDIIKWLTVLLDSHYHEYLVTKDENIIKKLNHLKEVIDSIVLNIQELQQFYKLVNLSVKTDKLSKMSVQYSVDKFRLY